MSAASLKQILNDLKSYKDFRAQVTNRYQTVLRLSEESLAQEFLLHVHKLYGEGFATTIDKEVPRIARDAFRVIQEKAEGKKAIGELNTRWEGPFYIIEALSYNEASMFDRIQRAVIKHGLDLARTELNEFVKNFDPSLPMTGSKFIDLGHTEQNIAAEVEVGRHLSGRHEDNEVMLMLSKIATKEKVDRIIKLSTWFAKNDEKHFLIELELEASLANQSKNDAGRIVSNLRKEIERHIEKKGASYWVNRPGSDSKARQIAKTIARTAVRKGGKFKGDSSLLQPVNRTPSKIQAQAKTRTTSAQGQARVRSRGAEIKVQKSYISVIEMINRRLPPQIRSNMGEPRLRNRSGRFSESARVIGVMSTQQGHPSFEYTYQRSPYDVFDRHLGKFPWNTPGRDPRQLVELSIRQIAISMNLGKYFLRRA